MPATILSRRTLHQGWTRLMLAEVRLDDGQVVPREIEDHGEAAAVLPYDAERGVVLLTRQLRPAILAVGVEDRPLEACAGLVDAGETGAAAARREAEEELGLRLSTLEPVAVGWSMPGISTERMHLFLAPFSAADRSGPGGGVAGEHENIEAVEVSFAQLAAWTTAGGLPDMKTLVLAQALQLRHPELFRG